MKTVSILNNFFQISFFERVVSLWPLIIVLVLLLLTFLWYNQVKIMRKRRERHERRGVPGLINPVILLCIITVMILMLLALPFFFDKLEEHVNEIENNEVQIDPQNIYDKSFIIEDIENSDYEKLLKSALQKHSGIKRAEISHVDNKAEVLYDTTKINRHQIREIIKSVGFEISSDNLE